MSSDDDVRLTTLRELEMRIQSRRIWKYTVPVDDLPHELSIPGGGRIVHVGYSTTAGELAFWVDLDPKVNTVVRKFLVIGTGHSIPHGYTKYRGTVQVPYLPLVWHLMEYDPDHD